MNINKKKPTIPRHIPHNCKIPNYGAKTQWKHNESTRHILPPVGRNIFTKGGFKIPILCNRSWPQHYGSVRNIGIIPVKRDRINQTISAPFTWLLRHKPIWNIEISFRRNYIAHTYRCIIPIIIHARSCSGGHCFLRPRIFNDTSENNETILTIWNFIKCNVVYSGGRSEGIVSQRQISGTNQSHPWGNGKPTTGNAHSEI